VTTDASTASRAPARVGPHPRRGRGRGRGRSHTVTTTPTGTGREEVSQTSSTRPRHSTRPCRKPADARPPRKPTKRPVNRAQDTGIPTPEQWAHEQLKNAPNRSQKWAREVAAIYGLHIAEK
jgi:hypothetical protein